MLPRVHQNLRMPFPQNAGHRRRLDKLRPGADHRYYFHLDILTNSSGMILGRYGHSSMIFAIFLAIPSLVNPPIASRSGVNGMGSPL